jgi:hypothetical protein
VRSLLPRVVDLSRKEEDRAFAQAIDRLDLQPSALIPICIKRRVVSFVYGDRSGEPFALEDLSALVGLLPHVSRAFERIIRTRKALAVHTHRSVRAASDPNAQNVDASRGLGHAATQQHVGTPLAAELAAGALAADVGALVANTNAGPAADGGGLALAEARTKQAMTSLGVPRTAPPPPTPRARLRSPAEPRRALIPSAAAASEHIDTLHLRGEGATAEAPRPSKPPTPFFSKPPPGAGRYSSQRDSVPPPDNAKAPGDANMPPRDAKPGSAPRDANMPPRDARADAAPVALPDADQHADAKAAERSPGEDTKPLRRARTPAPARASRTSEPASGSARPPPSDARASGRSSLPPADAAHASDGKSRSAARSSKPPPGAGTYRSQGFTTELISVPKHGDSAERPRESIRPPADPDEFFTDGRSSLLPGAARAIAAAAAHKASQLQPSAAETKAGSASAEQREQIAVLVSELRNTRPEDDGLLVQQLVRFGEEALDVLAAQFPGPLWFDRRRPHARVPLGRDISAIARAMVAFGDRAYARFTTLLRAPSGDVRYYATLFVSDRVYPPLLEPLIERLFDDDPQIRLMVRDTLPHYRRVAGFSKVTERLRSQAAEPTAPLKARLASLDAISVLRDAQSVPILIELINHSDKQISVPSQRALVAITCQDFAKSVKKWRAWYQENAARHRVEWLIEALMHSDQALRGAAGLELQKVTQVYYGYVAAAPKREREQAQRRYWDWWQSEGRGKF